MEGKGTVTAKPWDGSESGSVPRPASVTERSEWAREALIQGWKGKWGPMVHG